MKKRVFYLTAAFALACTSCGNGLNPVFGTVAYKGQPAAGAGRLFPAPGADLMNEPMIMGLVQLDGSFSLVCGDKGAGAPPGEYDVLIEWRPPSSQPRAWPKTRPTGSAAATPTQRTPDCTRKSRPEPITCRPSS